MALGLDVIKEAIPFGKKIRPVIALFVEIFNTQ
jgi:hypothetical protein